MTNAAINPVIGVATDYASAGNQQTSIFDKAVCLSVELRKPSNRRAGDLSQVETEADKSLLGLSKKLLDCPELHAIHALDSKLRKFLKEETSESPLRSGVYLVPIKRIERIDEHIQAFAAERQQAVNKFVAAYPAAVEEARERLKDQFDPANYHPVEALPGMFSVEQQWLNFGVPGQLAGVSQAIFKRAQQQAEARWEEATVKIQAALRESFQALVGHLVERLTPGEDGKRKQLKASAVEKVQAFLETFRDKNLTNDAELESLVEQAEGIVAGIDMKKLRSDELFRADLLNQFSQVGQQLDVLVEQSPGRQFFLDDAADSPATDSADAAAEQSGEPIALTLLGDAANEVGSELSGGVASEVALA